MLLLLVFAFCLIRPARRVLMGESPVRGRRDAVTRAARRCENMHAQLQHVINPACARGLGGGCARSCGKLGKSTSYIINCFSLKFREQQPWSSGMMLACHAGDPGSIPGGCSFASRPPSSPPLARVLPGGCSFALLLAALVAAARPLPSRRLQFCLALGRPRRRRAPAS